MKFDKTDVIVAIIVVAAGVWFVREVRETKAKAKIESDRIDGNYRDIPNYDDKFKDDSSESDLDSYVVTDRVTPLKEDNTVEQPVKQWENLLELTGSGPKKSTIFRLNGGDARLRYNYAVKSLGGFTVYVIPKGETLQTALPNPEVMITESEKNETSLSHLPAGDYYLHIEGINGKYKVIVEEYK